MTGTTTGRAARRHAAPPDPAAHWAYFLDIDGTLIDFAAPAARLQLDAELRDLIERLGRSAGSAVALISGRAIADIDRLFPHARLPVAGQHGTERRDAAGHISRHAFPVERLAAARARLLEVAAKHPGLWLEDKELSLALHYRGAPRLGAYVHRLMAACQAASGAAFCVQSGKRIVELKPAGRDKGVAVQEFMQEEPFRGRVPVFLGDDTTDEYGFKMVNRLGGHSVKVGSGPTAAHWRLRDVRSVRAWLARAVAVQAHA
jgi:trehalose 6-phosphate phosphatase